MIETSKTQNFESHHESNIFSNEKINSQKRFSTNQINSINDCFIPIYSLSQKSIEELKNESSNNFSSLNAKPLKIEIIKKNQNSTFNNNNLNHELNDAIKNVYKHLKENDKREQQLISFLWKTTL